MKGWAVVGRKLASVQYVHDVWPIEGADSIEAIGVLGWTCVAKKGEFAVGDSCVYFEIDSFLPIDDHFEFLRASSYKNSELLGEGFRLKTQKFRGQISQGLALPLSILPEGNYVLGQDVTELLGVRKWEIAEFASSNGTIIGGLPVGLPKTEESRVQAEPGLIDEFVGVPYYITTKMDGTSVSMFLIDGRFGVCGHNYEYADDGRCSFWDYARKHDIESKMRDLGIGDVVVQGEFCAAGIQKNPLRLTRPEWYIFTVYDPLTRKRFSLDRMTRLCDRLCLQVVPVEERGDDLPYKDITALLERARGNYPSGTTKEGIVIRPLVPVYSKTLGGPLSMKVINNDYLLKKAKRE